MVLNEFIADSLSFVVRDEIGFDPVAAAFPGCSIDTHGFYILKEGAAFRIALLESGSFKEVWSEFVRSSNDALLSFEDDAYILNMLVTTFPALLPVLTEYQNLQAEVEAELEEDRLIEDAEEERLAREEEKRLAWFATFALGALFWCGVAALWWLW